MAENGKTEAGPNALERALGRWALAMRKFAWAVIAIALVATAAAGFWTVSVMKINTNVDDLVDRKVTHIAAYDAYTRAFPQFSDNIVVVIEGQSGDAVLDAARELADRMRGDPKVFGSVFYPQGEPFFRRSGLLYLNAEELEALARRLAGAQPFLGALAQDPTLRGFANLLALSVKHPPPPGPQSRQLEGALGGVTAALEANLAGRAFRFSWSDLLGGAQGKGIDRRVLTVQPALDFTALQPASVAMKQIRALGVELGITPENGLRLRLTGGAAMSSEELKSVEEGMGLAGLLTTIFVFFLLMTGLRSFRLMIAALVTLVVGLIWTGAFAALAIGHLTLISVAFAVLFIGLSVDFSIHYVLRYQETAAREGDDRIDHGTALKRAAESVGGALLLCAVTAAIGFFSFLPTAYRGVAELGLISGGGMFIAFAVTFTVLPALLTVLPGRVAPNRALAFLDAGRLARAPMIWVRGNAVRIVAGVAVLAVGALILSFGVRFDFDPLNLRDQESESVRTFRDLVEKEGQGAYNAILLAPDLDAAEALAAKVRGLDTVKSVVTLKSFVPENQADKLAIIEGIALSLLPVLSAPGAGEKPTATDTREKLTALKAALAAPDGTREAGLTRAFRALETALGKFLAALEKDSETEAMQRLDTLETMLLGNFRARLNDLKETLEAKPVTLADLPADIRSRYVAADGRARVEIRPKGGPGDNAARRAFVEQLRTVAPEVTGSAVVALESGVAITDSFRTAGLIAFAAILLLLIVLLRNVWDVMLILVPLLLAALFTMAATVVFSIPFNFANVIVLPLLLGLGVASAIHLVMRDRDEGAGGPDTSGDLLQTSTPRAVLFSALTTIGSFASLATSSHPGTASMGVLLTIAILMTLVFTLIVLPAMIEIRNRRRGSGGAG